MAATAGTTTFSVTTACAWTVTETTSWLTVSPTSGTGNGTITITYEANTGVARVSDPITVSVSGVTPVSVTVSQAAPALYLTVTPANRDVTSSSGNTTFAISSNTTWTISDNATWFAATPTSGSNNGTITATYSANTGVQRVATITVTGAGVATPVTVTVTQAGPCTLTVTPLNQNVAATAGTTTFSITTTCAWTVSESESWLSVSPTNGTGNGTITATYSANSGAQRIGTVTVTVADVTPVTITVTQAGNCTLGVTPTNQNVAATAGTTTFSVTTACAWTVAENTGWLTASPTSGTGNGTITVTYEANTGVARVSDPIIVSVSGVTPVSVTVSQAAPALFLTVTPANRDVTSSSGNTTFAISSNTTWTISDNATWLAATPTSGSNNGTITATYSANTGVQRIGTITVTGAGVTPATTVTVTQAAAVVTRTITIASQNPASGVAITVSPVDNSGNANGTTQFTRVYNNATSVTLTAPLNTSGKTFSKWLKNSADFSTNLAITLSATAADTYTAVYLNGPENVTVTLPDTCLAGSSIEIPVFVSNVTGFDIISCQFVVTFDNTVIVPADPYTITTGTLCGTASWSVLGNPNTPGQITIGGFGSTALSGSGILLKVKFNIIGTVGDQSALTFTSFTFNAGIPPVTMVSGSFDMPVCGDADGNGLVQAYDAALILQNAIGLITLNGCIHPDVNGDTQITSFDAALVNRHAIGLPMPTGVTTCFAAKYGFAPELPKKYEFGAKLTNMLQSGNVTSAEINLRGIEEMGKVYAVSFDITSPSANIQNLTMPNLPNGYLMFMNPTDGHTYRVGIINTNGVLTNDMKMQILMTGFNDGTPLTISNILLNDQAMPDIRLAGNTISENLLTEPLVAYPNPFNSSTNITYQVTEDSQVQLAIMDMLGRKVKILVSETQEKGFYNVIWNGENNYGSPLQQGWYIVQLKAAGSVEQIKVNLMY